MNTHKNASMTPKGRAHLVREINRIGLRPAAEAAGLSPRTAREWHRRHAAEGVAGLLDRSSRPVRSPGRSDSRKLERAVALRRTQHLTYEHIAERVGLSKSVVARGCKAAGVARLPSCNRPCRCAATRRPTPASCCTWTPRSSAASIPRASGDGRSDEVHAARRLAGTARGHRRPLPCWL